MPQGPCLTVYIPGTTGLNQDSKSRWEERHLPTPAARPSSFKGAGVQAISQHTGPSRALSPVELQPQTDSWQ